MDCTVLNEYAEGASYVYVLNEVGSPYFKIGKADNPAKRVSELQTGNPRELVIVWLMMFTSADKALSTEKRLHRMFGDYRVRSTEWFALSSDALQRLEVLVDLNNEAAAATETHYAKLLRKANRALVRLVRGQRVKEQ